MAEQKTVEAVKTQVVTRKVRFSYLYIFEPRESQNGGKPKYSATLLIPKTDTVTLDAINKAIEAVKKTGEKVWGGKLANPKTTLHDGDGTNPSGQQYGDECKGCWVLNCSSIEKPGIVDANANPILDKQEIYSGCYGRADLNFFAFSAQGNKGVGCGLNNIQKLADGDHLDGRRKAEDVFSSPYDDDLLN